MQSVNLPGQSSEASKISWSKALSWFIFNPTMYSRNCWLLLLLPASSSSPHFPFLIIGIDPSDSCVPDKGSTTKLCPQVFLPVILRGSHLSAQTTCNGSCNSPVSVAGILVYDARPSNVSISLILIDSFKERCTVNQFKDNCLHLCHYVPVHTVHSQPSTLTVYFEWPPEAPRTEPTTADWFVCWNIQV